LSTLAVKRAAWTPYAIAAFRMMLALLFLEHGLSKFFDFPTPGGPLALFSLKFLSGFLETFGSIALFLGIGTVPVAFVLSGLMAVAYFMAHAPNSFFPLINHGELAIAYCFGFLLLFFTGGGACSLDRKFGCQT
jgi:putative oxidoreductase